MMETKVRETYTIVNGYDWNDCNSQLQESERAIERLKIEGSNPPFKRPTIIRNPFTNNSNQKQNLVNSEYVHQMSGIHQRSGFDSMSSTRIPITQNPFYKQDQGNSNSRSLLRELQNNNNRILDISESLSKSRSQYKSQQGLTNALPQSKIQSASKVPTVFLKSIQSYQGEGPYDFSKRIYIKCKDLEYEEYQDEQNSAFNYKAIRIGVNGEWEETKETPEIIKPIIALKNRINQSAENQMFTSRFRVPSAAGKMIAREKTPIFSSVTPAKRASILC